MTEVVYLLAFQLQSGENARQIGLGIACSLRCLGFKLSYESLSAFMAEMIVRRFAKAPVSIDDW
jgi:hypothetical protein